MLQKVLLKKTIMHPHHYKAVIEWTGNQGNGTSDYSSYSRNHLIQVAGKMAIAGSSDPVFRGDKTLHNPEDLLVASLSACHMLSYLHLCAVSGIVVTAYSDEATGTMVETAGGGGRFTEVHLHPVVTVKEPSMIELASELHHKAHENCFIASSCNFPVLHFATCKTL
jgi:organic hydroperoxide reductase OsmC/OhrA